MADVKGTALLPKGDKNGLSAIADELLKEPLRLRAALVVFDCKRGTEDYDLSDTVVPLRPAHPGAGARGRNPAGIRGHERPREH
jgi:hypothetical protein